ncbi:hypothetical protein A2U01_0020097, partial [Trifolium medium]|nr:hypothetical protein [Trifolium medium]
MAAIAAEHCSLQPPIWMHHVTFCVATVMTAIAALVKTNHRTIAAPWWVSMAVFGLSAMANISRYSDMIAPWRP